MTNLFNIINEIFSVTEEEIKGKCRRRDVAIARVLYYRAIVGERHIWSAERGEIMAVLGRERSTSYNYDRYTWHMCRGYETRIGLLEEKLNLKLMKQ